MQCKFEPYEGEQPFIFVSYSHKDGDRIGPILDQLHDAGFRIWYDEGIDWGTEWPDVIAKHLRLCQACLVFHSAWSAESLYCKREIFYATNLKKNILPVYLENVELNEGTKFLLGVYHAIFYWQYQDQEKFYQKLFSAPAIQICGNHSSQLKPMPAPKPAPAPDPKPVPRRGKPEQPAPVNRVKRGNHSYFCPGCGTEMDANTVLFDMSEIFFGQRSWKKGILKLAMTEMELRAIRRSGVWNAKEESRYVLTFPEILSFVANSHNLNDPEIAGLTPEELEEFLAWAPPAEDDDVDIFEASANGAAASETLPRWAPAIQAMLDKAPALESKQNAALQLKQELCALKRGLDSNGEYHFTVELRTEEDDLGDSVLTGMIVGQRFGGKYLRYNRVCPRCGRPVFEHAGTAGQRKVVFLGGSYQTKASIIMVLAHYTRNRMVYGLNGDPIWKNAFQISEVQDVELVDASEDVREDMARYEHGLPPRTVYAHRYSDAYSVTLRIMSGGRIRFLTLMELPGELNCNADGLREDAILYQFPAALSCDALVICVEGPEEKPTSEWMDRLRVVFNQAELCQNLLVRSGAAGYAPVMLLHTGCRELESGKWREPSVIRADPFQMLYILERERQDMRNYPRYQMVSRLFSNTGRLNQAFRAELRCSAYGCKLYDRTQQTSEGVRKTPEPIHMDLLMKWLLMVTGCIEINRITQVCGKTVSKLAAYTLVRGQYRSQNPLCKNGISAEAFARCALFMNPGIHDRQRVEIGDHTMKNLMYNLQISPDTNAEN